MEQDPRLNLPSASSLERLIRCPGSVAMIEQVRSESGGQYVSDEAAFGNSVHQVLSKECEEMSVSERAAYVARKCESIKGKLNREIFGEIQPATFVETRFWVTGRNNEKLFSAQLDWAGCADGKALILDFKALPGLYSNASENHQLLGQAVALMDDDETRNVNGPMVIHECFVAIVQPSISLKPEICHYGFDDLRRAKALIVKAIDESRAIRAPRIPGNHCKFCPANKKCPESMGDLLAMEKRKTLDISTLTPEMVANILPHIPALKKRITDFEAHAKRLAEDNQLPGYEIEVRQGNRFIQGQPAIQKVREVLGQWISKEDILKLMELPLGELREKFIEVYVAQQRVSKVDAGKELDKILDENNLCQRSSSSKRLVRKDT